METSRKVGSSVRKAIEDWEGGDLESAMMHACNAIEGTAAKTFPNLGSKERFVRLLRDNYEIFGPMGVPGVDLVATRFPVTVRKPTADGGPDLADIVYGIHRCTHAHGDELPEGFDLLPDAAGPPRSTHMAIEQGQVRLSDRIIFGLLAVAVLSPENTDQEVPEGYFLTFGTDVKLIINEWWGRAEDFPAIVATDPVPRVTFDFGDWMPND